MLAVATLEVISVMNPACTVLSCCHVIVGRFSISYHKMKMSPKLRQTRQFWEKCLTYEYLVLKTKNNLKSLWDIPFNGNIRNALVKNVITLAIRMFMFVSFIRSWFFFRCSFCLEILRSIGRCNKQTTLAAAGIGWLKTNPDVRTTNKSFLPKTYF